MNYENRATRASPVLEQLNKQCQDARSKQTKRNKPVSLHNNFIIQGHGQATVYCNKTVKIRGAVS